MKWGLGFSLFSQKGEGLGFSHKNEGLALYKEEGVPLIFNLTDPL